MNHLEPLLEFSGGEFQINLKNNDFSGLKCVVKNLASFKKLNQVEATGIKLRNYLSN